MEFKCPRCNHTNKHDKPGLLRREGFAICAYCQVGIKFKSTFLNDNVEIIGTYVPPGNIVSPKTGRYLGPETMSKSPKFVALFFHLLGLPTTYTKRMKREGHINTTTTTDSEEASAEI